MINPHLALIGCTGAVGNEVLHVLEKRNFPLHSLRCFASEKSKGQQILFKGEKIIIEALSESAFNNIDLAFFCAGKTISKEWAPIAIKHGAIVVDSSSYFRMHDDVPLVIPEINPHAILSHHRLIASPNCSTSILLMALAPLHKKFRLKRAVVSTYQAASGAGFLAMKELEQETFAHLQGRSFERTVIPHPYAFNLFTHNSELNASGYVDEEVKMLEESRKILEDKKIFINATCVRVPILRAHSESINATFEKPITAEDAYDVLRQSKGIKIFEDREKNRFPMPIDASLQDDVFCGRIRNDHSYLNTLDLWVVGDQLLKGAALNAVQIAELTLSHT